MRGRRQGLLRRYISALDPRHPAVTSSISLLCSSTTAIENVPGPVPIEGARPVTVAVIGAGQRGNAYAQYATHQPEACAIVAVAEPRPKTRERFVAAHGIDSSLVFGDWRDLLFAAKQTSTTLPGTRLADAIVVSVQDAMHMEVVLAFAELGYPILCEKPMATSVEDCLRMHAAVKKSGVVFGMGHGKCTCFEPLHVVLTLLPSPPL
jgi:threonine dehydrogenase-like Zn-dependent dehydrogenase